MKIIVQRFMDDGYGNTYIIEEGTFDESLIDEIDGMDDIDIHELLMNKTSETDVDIYSIGNPNGFGNVVDEYRIFKDGELYLTIVG